MKKKSILTAVVLAFASATVFAQAPQIDNNRVDALIKEQISLDKLTAEQLSAVRKEALLQLQRAEVLKQEALAAGLDKDADIKWQKENMEANFYAGQYLRHLNKTLEVNEADLRKRYAQMTREIKLQQATFTNIDDAQAALQKLRKGMSFGDLIATLENQAAALPDFINPQDLPVEIANIINTLSKGDITDKPFEYQGVFYLFKIQDSRTAQNLPSFEQLKPQLQEQEKEQQLHRIVDDLFQKYGLQ